MQQFLPLSQLFLNLVARHYTDFSPEKLKEIYDKADLKVLS